MFFDFVLTDTEFKLYNCIHIDCKGDLRMGSTLAYKILGNHLIEGELVAGTEITIKMDQTLTQDSTGTMVYLQLKAMNVDKVKTELSVAYIDHNTLQTGFENADRKRHV